jgi:hypothetical protein
VNQARLQRRILLAGYPFDGPYPSPDDLEGRPGVWVVLVSEEGAAWRPIDVGRSDTALPSVRDLRSGGSGAPRGVGFAASYTESDTTRVQIEREVRARYGLPRHE